MADETQSASISASVVETTEDAFVPAQSVTVDENYEPSEDGETIDTTNAVVQIFAELTPEETDENTYYSQEYIDWLNSLYAPYLANYKTLPEYESAPKELIINIETSGAKPWESKLFAIGVMDPNELEPQVLTFIQETEEETLNEFVVWFLDHPYDTLVGYNVAFDYRFIYVLLQKYRVTMPTWTNAALYDLMQQQKQVKSSFVYGMNPEGKLEDWATYLMGTQPYAKQEQVLVWYKEKNLDEIANFNADKVTKSYFLYVLGKIVAQEIPGQGIVGRPGKPVKSGNENAIYQRPTTAEDYITVSCPVCMQNNQMLKTNKTQRCFVCDTTIANPML